MTRVRSLFVTVVLLVVALVLATASQHPCRAPAWEEGHSLWKFAGQAADGGIAARCTARGDAPNPLAEPAVTLDDRCEMIPPQLFEPLAVSSTGDAPQSSIHPLSSTWPRRLLRPPAPARA